VAKLLWLVAIIGSWTAVVLQIGKNLLTRKRGGHYAVPSYVPFFALWALGFSVLFVGNELGSRSIVTIGVTIALIGGVGFLWESAKRVDRRQRRR